MPAKTRGQIAFEAHTLSMTGRPEVGAGHWALMGPAQRAHWEAAAQAVADAEHAALAGAPSGPAPRPERKGILTLLRPACSVCKTMDCTCPPPSPEVA